MVVLGIGENDMTNHEEIIEMAKNYLEQYNFPKTGKVRIKRNANGCSVKIGNKAFSSCNPDIWDCLADVETLETLGYDVATAKQDYEKAMA